MGFLPLPCETIIYRTITKRDHFQDGTVLAAAFHRPRKDEDGLSIDYKVNVPDGCAPDLKSSSKKAIVSFHVGKIRSIGLDAAYDSETHGVVLGLPFSDDETKIREREQYAAL